MSWMDNYLQLNLKGFKGLTLTENNIYEVDNPNIKSLKFDDELKTLTVYLIEGVKYKEHFHEIKQFLDHILFNLIIKSDAELNLPQYDLKVVKDESDYKVYEGISFKCSLMVNREIEAKSFYDDIVNSPTKIEEAREIYQRIFNILNNPNRVIQFMSLYQLLMELLSEGKRIEQKNVVEYFKKNVEKYPFIEFKPTRREVKNKFDEDSFTYMRNEIGHCEQTNDLIKYNSLGNKITSHWIKKFVSVINDVINLMKT